MCLPIRIAAGVAIAGVLTACGAGQQPTQVASLISGSGLATTTAGSDDSRRPQLRLDSSQDDINAAWAGYYACLKDHGHVMLHRDGTDKHAGVAAPPDQHAVESPDMNDDSPASVAARKACQNTLPLQPPELDKTTNPHYLDQYHTYLTCLTSHGLAVHAIDPFGTGWTYDDGVTQRLSETEQVKVDHDCRLSSFSLK